MPGLGSYYVPNLGGTLFIAASPLMQAIMGQVAQAIAERAREIAPYDENEADNDEPHFRDTIESDSGIDTDGAFGIVYVTARHGPYVEFGTADTPEFAPLRRAAEGVVGRTTRPGGEVE